MTNKIRYSVIGALIFVIAVVFLMERIWNRQAPAEITPRPVPEFALKDYFDQEVRLSNFKGQPVVVNAWAAWCPFCVDELPDFVKLQKEFGDKIAVIAINRAENYAVAKDFSDRYGATGQIILLLDPADSFYQSIGGFSMPETIFVDQDGFIKDHKRGPMKLEEMRRRVDQAFSL